jgi:hypothetical protein
VNHHKLVRTLTSNNKGKVRHQAEDGATVRVHSEMGHRAITGLDLNGCFKKEFCYSVYNQYESFIYLDLMVKNREVPIEWYFNW